MEAVRSTEMGDRDGVEQLMASLHRLSRLLASRQAASRVTAAAGVDISQQGATVLRALLRHGRQSMAAVASSASMDLGAVSRQVRTLEGEGLVRRLGDPDDARVALVELTAKGRRAAERVRAVSVRHLEQALGEWSRDDVRTLATLLQRLVDDMVTTPVPPATSGSAAARRRAG